MKTACPFCSHKKLLSGYNDLATTYPQIAAEWDYEKNKDNIASYADGSVCAYGSDSAVRGCTHGT